MVRMALTLLAVLSSLTISLAMDLHKGNFEAQKRSGSCPPWKPFQCPEGKCIPLKYLCDHNADCANGYDENRKMCIAATRPPVDETVDYLEALLDHHGKDFLGKLFGSKGNNRLLGLGGVRAVAVGLSESTNVEEFGKVMNLGSAETAKLREVLKAVHADQGDEYLGLKGSALQDLKFYVDKLVDTNFLD